MDSRAPRRLGLQFVVVSLLCLVMAGAAGVLLWRDYTAASRGGEGSPVASLEKYQAKVRRKARASFRWSSAGTGQEFYRRDSVQTGLESTASLRFTDGTLLEVGQNSLVVLDEAGKLSLSYMRGEAVLRGKSGDQRITVGEDGKTRIENVPIQLQKPEALSTIFVSATTSSAAGGAEIGFSWKVQDSTFVAANLNLEISRDEKFSVRATQRIALSGEGAAIGASVRLDEGSYFWRVTQGDKLASVVARFDVIVASPSRPTSPASSATASGKALSWGADSRVQFRWVAAKSAIAAEGRPSVEHRLQVSREPEFRALAVDERVAISAGTAIVPGVAPGKWFWRIYSRYGDQVAASRGEAFEAEAPKLAGVDQILPESEASFPVGKTIRFNWESELPEAEYSFEVQDLAGRSVAATKTRAKGAEWKNAKEGAYRWRVSLLSDGKSLVESPWRAVAVFSGPPLELVTPKRDAELRSWEKTPDFEFRWSVGQAPPSESTSYVFEASADSRMTGELISKKTQRPLVPSAQVGLKDGTWFWRVRQVSASGVTIKSSEVRKLGFGLFPVLRAPASAKPEPGAVFDRLNDPTEARVTWEKIDEAREYEVVITDASTKKVAFTGTSPEPALVVPDLREGDYEWTVSAVDRLGRKGEPMPVRTFHLTFGTPLPPPEIVSPEVQ